MRPRLRLFTGEPGIPPATERYVRIRLGEVTQILGDALEHNRAWMRDFADDEVQIPADLFEVMTTYWRMRTTA
jgi:hypothetical protein